MYTRRRGAVQNIRSGRRDRPPRSIWKLSTSRRIRVAVGPKRGHVLMGRSISWGATHDVELGPRRYTAILNVLTSSVRAMAITVTQLRAFLAVIEGGSVTAAADALVVTQPSVSSALAGLGRELGCELFKRSGRGIRLTEAGAAFAPYA